MCRSDLANLFGYDHSDVPIVSSPHCRTLRRRPPRSALATKQPRFYVTVTLAKVESTDVKYNFAILCNSFTESKAWQCCERFTLLLIN